MLRVLGSLLIAGAISIITTAGHAAGLTIGASWSNLQEDRQKATEAAMKVQIQIDNNNYLWADAQSSASKQVADIESLIARGADVLIIHAQDPDAIRPAVERAMAQGVAVIAIDRPIEHANVYVGLDAKEVGRIQARAVYQLRPEGNYVFIKGSRNDPNADLIFSGQMEVLREAIDSGQIRNVGEAYTDGWRPDNAQRNLEQILKANDNRVDAVIASDDSLAGGAIAALQEQGLAGSVPVSGQGGDPSALRRILLGTQLATIRNDEREVGVRAAYIAVSLVQGAAVERHILLQPDLITRNNLEQVTEPGWVQAKSRLPVVDVCFASDRKPETAGSRLTFSHERNDNISLGFARVSIPKDNHEFGKRERPEKLRFFWIEYGHEAEDPDKHFVIQDIHMLNEDNFITKSKSILTKSKFFKNHILVFIPGFNASFDDAIYTAAQISWDINFDGLPCTYSWPSMAELSLTGYVYDMNSAQQSRKRLAHFLKMLTAVGGTEHISIIAHSMGNLALVEAIRELPLPIQTNSKPYSQLILAAPDLDRDNFLSIADRLPKYADGVTLYASSNDLALKASERLAARIPRAGDVPTEGPIIIGGVDSIDASAVSDYVFGLNHSYFATNRSVVADIGRLILKGERPPPRRDTTFRAITKATGESYWKFPN